MTDPINLVATPAIVVDDQKQDDGGTAWVVWFCPDRTEPERRELIAISDIEAHARWVAKALRFWIDPLAGQEAAAIEPSIVGGTSGGDDG